MVLSVEIKANEAALVARATRALPTVAKKAAEKALRAAMPILYNAVRAAAGGEGGSIQRQHGEMEGAVRILFSPAAARKLFSAMVYVDAELAPYAEALEEGKEISAKPGKWMTVPLSSGGTYPEMDPEVWSTEGQWWKSAKGHWLFSVWERPGVLTNLVVLKKKVKMPKTRWFTKAISRYADKFLAKLRKTSKAETRDELKKAFRGFGKYSGK